MCAFEQRLSPKSVRQIKNRFPFHRLCAIIVKCAPYGGLQLETAKEKTGGTSHNTSSYCNSNVRLVLAVVLGERLEDRTLHEHSTAQPHILIVHPSLSRLST